MQMQSPKCQIRDEKKHFYCFVAVYCPVMKVRRLGCHLGASWSLLQCSCQDLMQRSLDALGCCQVIPVAGGPTAINESSQGGSMGSMLLSGGSAVICPMLCLGGSAAMGSTLSFGRLAQLGLTPCLSRGRARAPCSSLLCPQPCAACHCSHEHG